MELFDERQDSFRFFYVFLARESFLPSYKQALGFTGRQREQRITIKLPLSEGTGRQTRAAFGSLK